MYVCILKNDIKIQFQMVSVVIVDDYEIFRYALRSIIESRCPEMSVVGEAGTGSELFGLLSTVDVDIVLLDIKLPDMSGIDIARRMRRDYPDVKILAVSMENTTETVRELLDIGIDGFISKSLGKSAELPDAMRAVLSGHEYFGRDIAAIIYDIYVAKKNTAEPSPEFSARERDILLLCREGLLSKQIADRLNISPRTVETHKTNIFRKLGLNSTMEMVQYALRKGIIRVEK